LMGVRHAAAHAQSQWMQHMGRRGPLSSVACRPTHPLQALKVKRHTRHRGERSSFCSVVITAPPKGAGCLAMHFERFWSAGARDASESFGMVDRHADAASVWAHDGAPQARDLHRDVLVARAGGRAGEAAEAADAFDARTGRARDPVFDFEQDAALTRSAAASNQAVAAEKGIGARRLNANRQRAVAAAPREARADLVHHAGRPLQVDGADVDGVDLDVA